ncbi:MAG TPA: exo-alpha-sialidase, partial [Rhodospirillales bacterium]
AKPSGFGFAVAAHPRDPKTAWFVPATKDERRVPVDGKIVVSRTRDGGKSFDVLSRGLPQRHAYDLVHRHALAIDEGGERLAFGSTSGGLWVSEDGGDSWAALDARLPPVSVVRFAVA